MFNAAMEKHLVRIPSINPLPTDVALDEVRSIFVLGAIVIVIPHAMRISLQPS